MLKNFFKKLFGFKPIVESSDSTSAFSNNTFHTMSNIDNNLVKKPKTKRVSDKSQKSKTSDNKTVKKKAAKKTSTTTTKDSVLDNKKTKVKKVDANSEVSKKSKKIKAQAKVPETPAAITVIEKVTVSEIKTEPADKPKKKKKTKE